MIRRPLRLRAVRPLEGWHFPARSPCLKEFHVDLVTLPPPPNSTSTTQLRLFLGRLLANDSNQPPVSMNPAVLDVFSDICHKDLEFRP
jgi:hypothetical protein